MVPPLPPANAICAHARQDVLGVYTMPSTDHTELEKARFLLLSYELCCDIWLFSCARDWCRGCRAVASELVHMSCGGIEAAKTDLYLPVSDDEEGRR